MAAGIVLGLFYTYILDIFASICKTLHVFPFSVKQNVSFLPFFSSNNVFLQLIVMRANSLAGSALYVLLVWSIPTENFTILKSQDPRIDNSLVI